jgi:hypothetical protein
MKKLKAIIHIIKVLKQGTGENDLVKLDKLLTDFYRTKGLL